MPLLGKPVRIYERAMLVTALSMIEYFRFEDDKSDMGCLASRDILRGLNKKIEKIIPEDKR